MNNQIVRCRDFSGRSDSQLLAHAAKVWLAMMEFPDEPAMVNGRPSGLIVRLTDGEDDDYRPKLSREYKRFALVKQYVNILRQRGGVSRRKGRMAMKSRARAYF